MRPKYKALYLEAVADKQEVTTRLMCLRGYVDRLTSHGERIAELWTQAGDVGLVAPRPLSYPDWLAFAVYMGKYQPGSANVLEEPGMLALQWRGRPVVYEQATDS